MMPGPTDAPRLRIDYAETGTLDGWLALKAQLPPKERRGIVLIDPPFEEERELERMGDGLGEGLRRFATGIFIAWYPIKNPKPVARFHRAVAAVAGTKLLLVEAMLRRPVNLERLNGCGLERGEIGKLGMHTCGGHVELRRPDDAVQDQPPQVVVLPVLVEVRHHDADAAAAIGSRNRPGDCLLRRGLRRQHRARQWRQRVDR